MNFLTLQLWFGADPGPLTPAFRYALIAVIILFAVSTIVSWLKKGKAAERIMQRLWESVLRFSATGVLLGALLLFFTEQSVPVLAARFWFALWAVIQIWWAYGIIRRARLVPQIKKDIEQKQEFNKYIP